MIGVPHVRVIARLYIYIYDTNILNNLTNVGQGGGGESNTSRISVRSTMG